MIQMSPETAEGWIMLRFDNGTLIWLYYSVYYSPLPGALHRLTGVVQRLSDSSFAGTPQWSWVWLLSLRRSFCVLHMLGQVSTRKSHSLNACGKMNPCLSLYVSRVQCFMAEAVALPLSVHGRCLEMLLKHSHLSRKFLNMSNNFPKSEQKCHKIYYRTSRSQLFNQTAHEFMLKSN